ncbi:MAG TPA: SIMPL domain-containing protein [Ramlibacter sp.]|nr:SIMPL domain-containing protein [Ramlibacter sp.]HVZ43156.1 SIMPL domain-containing protein [Ramlibacter sp.]
MLLCALAACCTGAFAQGASAPAQNVLQLSASGVVEVSQDLLSLHLNTTREGADPALVQSQLRTALDAALNEARKSASPGQLDVRTGNFAIYPRNSRDGKLNGWQGQAELVLEGRDFARITQAAGRIQTMTLAGAGFGLSREQRAKVEGEAQAIAIERFKSRAIELAKAFGFSGYTLREVSVQDSDAGYPRPVMMRQAMAAEGAAAPIPVEAGRASVTVTVSGSVQLR